LPQVHFDDYFHLSFSVFLGLGKARVVPTQRPCLRIPSAFPKGFSGRSAISCRANVLPVYFCKIGFVEQRKRLNEKPFNSKETNALLMTPRKLRSAIGHNIAAKRPNILTAREKHRFCATNRRLNLNLWGLERLLLDEGVAT
jgi:hypothetical protein